MARPTLEGRSRGRRRGRRSGLLRRFFSTRQRRLRALKLGAVWLGVCWAIAFVGWFVLYIEPHRMLERIFIKSLVSELVKGSDIENVQRELLGPGKEGGMSPQERARLKEQLKRQFGR